MGRGSKIKQIEKNGYSKFKQVLVRTGERKKSKQEIETSVVPERTQTSQKAETPKSNDTPETSPTPKTSEKADRSGNSVGIEKPEGPNINDTISESKNPTKYENLVIRNVSVKSDGGENLARFEISKPGTSKESEKFNQSGTPRKSEKRVSLVKSELIEKSEKSDLNVSVIPDGSEKHTKVVTTKMSEMSNKFKHIKIPKATEALKASKNPPRMEANRTPIKSEELETHAISKNPLNNAKHDKIERSTENVLENHVKPVMIENGKENGGTESSMENGTNEISAKLEKFENLESCENFPIINTHNNISVREAVKHPLENSWGMWLITNNKRNWEDNLVNLTTFNTVEDFWCLYHHMKPPSQLERGNDYAVFKKESHPMWEDPANRDGGRWLINFDTKRNESSDLDSIWMYVVLMAIGEGFKFSDAICGIVVNVRAKSRVAVWMADYKNQHAILETGRTLRNTLGLKNRLSFQQHNTTESIYVM